MFIVSREDWDLLQWAKMVRSGDLAPLPFQDHDDEASILTEVTHA